MANKRGRNVGAFINLVAFCIWAELKGNDCKSEKDFDPVYTRIRAFERDTDACRASKAMDLANRFIDNNNLEVFKNYRKRIGGLA